MGHVPESQLPSLYRAADLHVLVSVSLRDAVEGFGLVCLEAQSCGVPALGSDAGGIADAIVEGQGGFIVPAGDSPAVARHLAGLLAEPERYRNQGALGRARVQAECTWRHYASTLLAEVGEANEIDSRRVEPRRA
jgi:phosphatidylinositol alpha-1,6-mannosyltransferase